MKKVFSRIRNGYRGFFGAQPPEDLDDIQIYFGVDDRYVWPLLVALFSAKKNHIPFSKCNLAFDPSELSILNRGLIQDSASSIGIQVNFTEIQLLPSANFSGHLSKSSILRLSVPDQSKDFILWLDADLLLLKDWHQVVIYAQTLTGSSRFLAARSHWKFNRSLNNYALIKSGGSYFNSGVMLINCRLWQKLQIKMEVIYLLERYIEYNFEWADQCVLNYLTAGEYSSIPQQFNAPPIEFSADGTRILHFAGSNKPWCYETDDSGQLRPKQEIAILEFAHDSELEAFILYRSIESEALEKYGIEVVSPTS